MPRLSSGSPCLVLLLLACDGEKPAGDSEGSVPTGSEPVSPDLVVGDEHNFSYSGVLDAPSVATAEYTDITVSWAAVESDIQCHPFDTSTEADNLALVVLPNLTEEEVEDGLSRGTLQQSDLQLYVNLLLDGSTTSAPLSALTFLGTDPGLSDYYAEGRGTWMLLLTTGTQIGVGARDLMFLRPTAGETNVEAGFGDGCGILDFTPDLRSLTPLPVPLGPPGGGTLTLDWSALTVDGQATPINLNNIDRVMVGHYPDHSPADLEASFFDLERITTELWYQDLSGGSSVTLDALTGASGAFPGFSTDGTWILALRCSLCPNPAPLFLTVLAPR